MFNREAGYFSNTIREWP